MWSTVVQGTLQASFGQATSASNLSMLKEQGLEQELKVVQGTTALPEGQYSWVVIAFLANETTKTTSDHLNPGPRTHFTYQSPAISAGN